MSKYFNDIITSLNEAIAIERGELPVEKNGFYERLYNVLKEKKIKQYIFFKDLGITKQAASRWKFGSIPNTEIFLKICKYLNVNPYYLYFGIDENEEIKALKNKAAKYDELISFILKQNKMV